MIAAMVAWLGAAVFNVDPVSGANCHELFGGPLAGNSVSLPCTCFNARRLEKQMENSFLNNVNSFLRSVILSFRFVIMCDVSVIESNIGLWLFLNCAV